MQRLLLLGLNHATAPLPVREKLSFNPQQIREAVASYQQRFPDSEIVLLSTCNRVELYTARTPHGHPRNEQLVEFLAEFHSLSVEDFRAHLYQKTDREVVMHLFSVAASLNSMVIGETQILGQVRQAYDLARELESAGGLLNPLFQRAIAVGKQVLSDTAIAEGRLSVASVAVDYARRIFDRFHDKTILTIGAGKMTTLVLQSFAGMNPQRLLICNRDPVKAVALAAKFSGVPAPFEHLAEHLAQADVVITSTGSADPIITRQQFEQVNKQRRYRPLFIIDIALPRDVEAEVGKIDNVYLYNIDDLQQVVAATHSQRRGSIEAAMAIVTQQVEEFAKWHRARELGPLIDQLSKRYHKVAQEELNRTLNKLPNISAAEKALLEDLARRITNKLLHDPIQTLRESDSLHGPTMQYLHAMQKLFQLEPREEGQGGRSDETKGE